MTTAERPSEDSAAAPAVGIPLDRRVRARAWILEPKTQRHPGRWFHYGTTAKAPTDEELEWAEVDGTKYTPLYEEKALRDDERETCARQLELLGQHELAHCLRNYRENLGGSERPNVMVSGPERVRST